MRKAFAKCAVVLGVGLAALAVQGCKKKAAPAPVQTVVRSVPQVQPDFQVGSLPVEEVDPAPRVNRAARVLPPVQPVPAQSTDAPAADLAAAQRVQDARLLEEQRADSQRQQQELDEEIQQIEKTQQEVQEEPRIEDGPSWPGQTTPPLQPTQPQN
jgi:type IV secretory pathway VirB10-like protein